MELRSALTEERLQWQERQEQWDIEIQLLEQEKRQLQEQLHGLQDKGSTAKALEQETTQQKEALESILQALEPFIQQAQTDLVTWQTTIPASLNPQLTQELTQVHAEETSAKRLQQIIGLYSEIENLQANLHQGHELLDTASGQRRQVDVLYLGLARGFAVSPDNQWAAVGQPNLQGWTWTPRPALAPAIRQALDILQQQQTATWIDLPLSVSPDTAKGEQP